MPPAGRPADPGSSRRSQRIVAVILTVLLFGLIIVGAGAAFAAFGHRGWGYLVGALFCAVMALAGYQSRNR